MTVKSIIEIEINDARFNNYQKLFADYEKRLAGHPKIWAQINSQIRGGVTGFNELVALEVAAIGKQKLMAEAQAKAIRLTKTEAEYWREMAHSTKTVASNIASATTSLLKWGTLTSVFTGLLGAGGLFGIERLGQAAAGGRQRGLATNTTFGEQRAFSTNFGRLVDPGMLANVNEALHTASGRASLYGAGVRDLSGNTSDVALRVLQGLKGIANATPDALLGDTLQARGLDKLISLSEFQKIKATSQGELAGLVGGFGRDRNAMGVGERDLRLWQEFVTKLEGAGNTIESVFIRGLTPLTPGLTKLSEALTHVVEKFFGNKTSLDEIIGKAGAGLERFADYVGTPEFQKDVETFVNGVGFMAKKIAGFVGWLGGGEGSEEYEASKARAAALRADRASGKATALSQLGAIFGGGSQDQLLALVRGLERSGDSAVSPKGAVGRYQVTPDTARTYGFDPSRLTDPAYSETVARAVLADLSKRYGGNTDEILAAYNAGPGRANKYRSSGHDPGSIPEETRKYIEHAHKMSGYTPTVNVKIENEAGGTIISNTRQVAE